MSWKVTLEKVIDIQPISGADNIELAFVLGWQCVVKKGEFQVGDLAVYIPIDSVVPPTEVFKFMEPRKYRVTTVKLRKTLSQGLLLPLSYFPELIKTNSYEEGTDVTELLNITKYEKPIGDEILDTRPLTIWDKILKILHLQKKRRKKTFPDFLCKTDEERIQNMPSILRDAQTQWEVSEKLNGSSCTVFYRKTEKKRFKKFIAKLFGKPTYETQSGICTRNTLIKRTELTPSPQNARFINAAEESLARLVSYCERNNCNLAIQGELVGPGVQQNYYNLEKNFIRYFKIWDIDAQKYLTPDETRTILTELDLPTVPILETNITLEEFKDLQSLLSYAEGKSVINNKITREGVVFKDCLDGNRSFKVVSNKYLLKENE